MASIGPRYWLFQVCVAKGVFVRSSFHLFCLLVRVARLRGFVLKSEGGRACRIRRGPKGVLLHKGLVHFDCDGDAKRRKGRLFVGASFRCLLLLQRGDVVGSNVCR